MREKTGILMGRSAWTPAEDEQLLAMSAANASTREMAGVIGRSAGACKSRLQLLRRGAADDWTDKDRAALVDAMNVARSQGFGWGTVQTEFFDRTGRRVSVQGLKGQATRMRLEPLFDGATRRKGTYRPSVDAVQVRRNCLRCRGVFMSEHTGHRVCRACKESREWRDGDDGEFQFRTGGG